MTGYHKVVWEDTRNIAMRDLPWKQFKNSTVLITGASGFIPAYIVYTLLCRNDLFNDNIQILALVRSREKALARFADIFNRRDFKILVRDVAGTIDYKINADYIIHAASPASKRAFTSDPVGTLQANITGTINMLELARRSNSRGVLFLSSGMVYGSIGSIIPISEHKFGATDSMDKSNVYTEAKRAGEMLCTCYHASYGTPVKVVRLFEIYGPGEQIETGRAVIDFARTVYLGRDIVLKSQGRAIRSFSYVMDAVEAIFTVILKGEAGKAYNVGSDTDVLSILELARKFTAAIRDKPLKVILPEASEVSGDITDCFIPELTHLYTLGWKQRTSIERGISRMLKSFD